MIMSLTRLDKSIYPEWVPIKDGGYLVYLVSLKMHHYHNNPVTCVFANLLAGSLDNYHVVRKDGNKLINNPEAKLRYQKDKRFGNTFYMFYVLKKFPIL